MYHCLFWVVEWCKCLIWSKWRTSSSRFYGRNFLLLLTLQLRKKKTSSVEPYERCLPRDSTKEVVFRNCDVHSGRKLLPWKLTEDVFRELPRNKFSSVVDITTAEDSFFRGLICFMIFSFKIILNVILVNSICNLCET